MPERRGLLVVYPDSHRIEFYCPACRVRHPGNVGPNGWTFNGNYDRPTFSPSFGTRGFASLTDAECVDAMRGKPVEHRPTYCHVFVTDGRIHYLDDCTHDMRGQVVDMIVDPRDEEAFG